MHAIGRRPRVCGSAASDYFFADEMKGVAVFYLLGVLIRMRSVLAILILSVVSTAAQAQDIGTPASGKGARWWDGAVFYEVFVRSFADSTDGPLADDGIGDLRGLIDKLDYLNDGDPDTHDDLGVTGIWLMPIMQSSSYHGYDTTDYYAVEDDYGTNEDFRELMEAAHSRGIRVIVDLVLNHSSREHPWFRGSADPRSAHHDWYLWSKRKPDYKGPWGQDVWHGLDGMYYYGVFSTSMPDLNYKNPAVTRQMLDVTRFWLEDMGADGFRLDAIKHMIERGEQQEHTRATHQWLRGFYTFYKEVNPQALAVGEVWTGSKTVSAYVGDQMDLAFEFDLAYATMHAANTGERARLAKTAAAVLRLFPRRQYATFLANHDMDRAASQFGGDMAKAKLAATIQLTSPGVPFVYYGEEIGMSGHGPHPDIRSPMQWTPDPGAGFSAVNPWHRVNSDHQQVNVQTQADDEGSLLHLYRRLIRLRQEHPALSVGDFRPVDAGHGSVYAYWRLYKGEAMLVIINLSDAPVDRYGLALSHRQVAGAAGAVELLHGVDLLPQGGANEMGGGGYQPIGVLAPRTGYVLDLTAESP